MTDIPSYEVPPQMRDLAENSVTQAKTAFSSFMDTAKRNANLAQGTVELARSTSQDIYARGMGYAEQNVHAAFDFAQKLARAGTMQEAMQLQSEFMRSQFAAMQAQAKEFSGMAQGAMQKGAEQTKTAMQEGAAQTRKAMEFGRDAAQQTAHDAQQVTDPDKG